MAGYIDEAIVALLRSDAELVALVADRIYPRHLPQGAILPAVRYQTIFGREEPTITGPMTGEHRDVIQITSVGGEHSDAARVSRRILRILNGYQGQPVPDGVTITQTTQLNKIEIPYVRKDSAGDSGFYQTLQDFAVHYSEES